MKSKLLLGSILSVAFLFLAFRNARIDEVVEALRSTRYDRVLLTVPFTIACFALRAIRWRYLLLTIKDVPLRPLWNATMIGFMGNNLFPARLGEVWRAYLIGNRAGISRSAAFGSIVVERLFDTLVLLGIFGGVLATHKLPASVEGWGVWLLALTVPLYGSLALFFWRAGPWLALIRRVAPSRFRDRAIHVAVNFREGLGIFSQIRPILICVGLSFLSWGCLVVVVKLCFDSLQLDLMLDAAVVVLAVMAVGTMVPSAPGFVGTLQYAGILALRPYAACDPAHALTFTILYHTSQWIPTTLIGLISFLNEHLDFREVASISPSGQGRSGPISEKAPQSTDSSARRN